MSCFHNEKNNGAPIFKNEKSLGLKKLSYNYIKTKQTNRPYQNPGFHLWLKAAQNGPV